MFVLTLDQRASRQTDDLVGPWMKQLNDEFVTAWRLPFVRTAGDEMQALFTDAAALIEVTLRAHAAETWWVGIGLGEAEPLGDTARESRGPAFQHARTAVELAKSRTWRCAVVGEPAWAAAVSDGILATLAHVRANRTAHANDLVDRALSGVRQVQIARDLEITPQAVSKQLKRAGLDQERLGRKALEEVLNQAHE
jgi:hypothetical protein